MLKVKEYKISKTAAKTAKENNLVMMDTYAKQKYLFDFSLLDSLLVEEWEKDIIKANAKNVSCAFKESFYGNVDNFFECMGKCLYYPHKVYNATTGKRLYVIFQLAKIDHNTMTRKSIYDQFETVNQKIDSGYIEPIQDIEI